MKKSVKVLLGVIFAILLLMAAILPQVKLLTLGDGERVLVYMPSLGMRPGGSSGADLAEELSQGLGPENEPVEQPVAVWQGRPALVRDTSSYWFEFLGRSLDEHNYIRCTVTTLRCVTFLDGDGGTAQAERTGTYLGVESINDRARAKVLWDTLEETYPDGRAYFEEGLETAP